MEKRARSRNPACGLDRDGLAVRPVTSDRPGALSPGYAARGSERTLRFLRAQPECPSCPSSLRIGHSRETDGGRVRSILQPLFSGLSGSCKIALLQLT